jgi:hypothetical protein
MDNFMITFGCTSVIGEDTHSIIVTAPTIEDAEDIVRYSSLWKDIHVVSSIPYNGNPDDDNAHWHIDGSEYDWELGVKCGIVR